MNMIGDGYSFTSNVQNTTLTIIDMGSCQSSAQALIKFSATCSFEVQFTFNTVIYILTSSAKSYTVCYVLSSTSLNRL